MKIHDGWLRDCRWKYYAKDSTVNVHIGMYLICNNGYLQWPTSIYPYTHVGAVTTEGYFSANLESLRKDVTCTFGILKKRWRIHNHDFQYCDINVCVFFYMLLSKQFHVGHDGAQQCMC
jgi:hypothetical protein